MTRLAWGLSGQRHFEAGTDRGVLYLPGSSPGVPWNGLVSVNEKPSGGGPKAYYLDGIKYLNISAAEEFEASISAFSAPDEFSMCDGMASLSNGLFVTQQPRLSFGFSYRTLIGNDLSGLELGYKIHLVYNAMVAPGSKDNQTLKDSVSPTIFSWDVTTLPEMITGVRPSSHLIIDTRYADPTILFNVESILYGDDLNEPRLPTPYEIHEIFEAPIIGYGAGAYGRGPYGG